MLMNRAARRRGVQIGAMRKGTGNRHRDRSEVADAYSLLAYAQRFPVSRKRTDDHEERAVELAPSY